MPDIGDVLKRARARERSVTVCLAGDLAAEVERLEAEIQQAAQWKQTSIADTDPRKTLAKKIEALRVKMRESEVVFTFRALGAKAWSDLTAQHPGKTPGEAWDVETLAPALVAASAVDPVMEPAQVEELFEVLNHGQREALMSAAWEVNGEATSVPFSLLGSAILGSLTVGK